MQPKSLSALLFFLCLSCPISIWAQADSLKTEAIFDLSNPQQSLNRHLYYLQGDSYQPEISAAVIPGDLDIEKKIEAVIRLKEIYDLKGDFIYTDLAPDDPNYLDTLSNLPRYHPLPNKYPKIYLEKQGDQWQYSPNTMRNLLSIYQRVIPKMAQIFKSLVPQVSGRKVLGLKVWQWLGLLIVSVLSFVFYAIMDRSFAWGIRRIVPKVFSTDLLNLDRVPPAAHIFGYLLLAILLRN
ncbi:MAG: hypothetical protein AAF696_05660, partial [Bacteroidota bacterium]